MAVTGGTLPAAVRKGVEAALSASYGSSARIVDGRPLTGGSFHQTLRLTADCGTRFFLKWNDAVPESMFEAEAEGLQAISAARGEGLYVPEVIGHGRTEPEGGVSWLLLEFIDPAGPLPELGERLGTGLAALHSATRVQPDDPEPERLGWHRDNFIGTLPQLNEPTPDWTTFWRDRRLLPQFRLARELGFLGGGAGAVVERLIDRVDDILPTSAPDGVCLLHGDLWGGNVFGAAGGLPVLIDPAVYRGHREVDLAMSELFGFPAGFLGAYRDAWPLEREYHAYRRDLYQLYYLLAHVNLFGGSYVRGCRQAAERVLAAI